VGASGTRAIISQTASSPGEGQRSIDGYNLNVLPNGSKNLPIGMNHQNRGLSSLQDADSCGSLLTAGKVNPCNFHRMAAHSMSPLGEGIKEKSLGSGLARKVRREIGMPPKPILDQSVRRAVPIAARPSK
jgi:hypothetical protein